MSIRNAAARRIQHLWKKYRIFSMIPKALKARKNMAATLVQRYVRGYIDFTNIRTIINQKKLKENLEYFGKIKFTLESNAQVKIRYY